MVEALFVVWESRKNNPHGQINRQNAGKKKMGGYNFESKNETKKDVEPCAVLCTGAWFYAV